MGKILVNEIIMIVEVFEDLLVLFNSPRVFFRKIENLSVGNLLKRIITYYICFEILIILFFSFTIADILNITLFQIFLFSLADILLSLLFVPSFVIASRLASPKISLKAAVIYPILAKAIFILFPMISYALYLLTENMIFVYIRGSLAYAYLIALCFVYPYLFYMKKGRRFLVIFVSLVLVIMTNITVLRIATDSYTKEPSENFKFLLLQFDPIGYENKNKILELYKSWPDLGFMSRMTDEIFKRYKNPQNGNFLTRKDLSDILDKYKDDLKSLESRNLALKKQVLDIYPKLKFSSNKEILILQLQGIDLALEASRISKTLLYDELKFGEICVEISQKQLECQEKHNEMLRELSTFLAVRMAAMEMGFLFY